MSICAVAFQCNNINPGGARLQISCRIRSSKQCTDLLRKTSCLLVIVVFATTRHRRAGFLGSGASVTAASVVSRSPAIDAAFCSAVRTTFVGSMIPAATRSSNSPVAALKPLLPFNASTFPTITAPSTPAFSAIRRSGSSSARLTILRRSEHPGHHR